MFGDERASAKEINLFLVRLQGQGSAVSVTTKLETYVRMCSHPTSNFCKPRNIWVSSHTSNFSTIGQSVLDIRRSSSSSCISFKITEYIHELGARIGAQPGWLFEAPLLQSVDPDPPPTAAPPRATRSTLNVKFQRWPLGGPPGATHQRPAVANEGGIAVSQPGTTGRNSQQLSPGFCLTVNLLRVSLFFYCLIY